MCKTVVLFIYFRTISAEQTERRKSVFLLAQETALLTLKKDPSNPKVLYLILIMNIEIKKPQHKPLSIPAFKNPEDLASKLMNLNKYLGYLGWAEVYLHTPTKVNQGRSVLKDLIKEYPTYPHAYLRLWALHDKEESH